MKKYYGILKEIDSDDLIITANRRLSSHLEPYFGSKPSIKPLSQWLTEIGLLSNPNELLLDTQQSLLVWQNVVQSDTQHNPLLDIRRAAELAQQAWQLLCDWKVPLDQLSADSSEDVQAFLRWARLYKNQLEQNAWSDNAQIFENCLPYLLASSGTLPKKIIVLGFDSLTPAARDFFNALSTRTEIIFPTEFCNNSTQQRLSLTDQETEYRIMARWAKESWQQNPRQKITCVVPELLSVRRTIERIFQEELSQDYEDAVNIAGGYPLLSYPMIQLGLTFIQFISGQFLSRSQITSLLLSPFFSGGDLEYQERALLDRQCRQIQQESMSIADLIKHLGKNENCPLLLKILSQAHSLYAEQSEFNSSSAWSKFFSDILTLSGWPGEKTVSSAESQLINAFWDQLKIMAHCDWLLQKQSLGEALHSLVFFLSKALFQAESPHHAPIQVLGILEANAVESDKLWICNLNDDTWPSPASPNPFLPIHLQRKLSMPHSSAIHELEYSKRILHRLEQSCTELIASYSVQDQKENRELSPSPLILAYPEITVADLKLSPLDIPRAQPQTEPWSDDYGPAIQPQEKIRGGATILKRQAECPFWAFAEIRLDAKPFEDLELGLSAAERGSLVHAVLATVWRHVGDSDTLHRMNESELKELINNSIITTVHENQELNNENNSQALNQILRELEIKRLEQLIFQWLMHEKTRSPFKVSAIEKPVYLTVAELPLALQVDRIDILEDGSEIIIDYKTGSPSPSAWFGERPEEPQLPLYALNNPRQVRGLAFAQVRAQSIKFNGLTAEAGQLPGVKASALEWSVLIENWQSALTELALQFSAGDARVTPKNYPSTCAYCHLSSFCRINELELIENE